MPNNYPNGSNQNSSESRHPRYIGSAFRIGNPDSTQESLEAGERVLKWLPTEIDARVGELAGWVSLENGIDEDGFGFIKIPTGTRSASTVLSGMEAWEGEKAEILNFVANYEERIYKQFDGFDTAVELNYVAVTKDRRLFIVPPHKVTTENTEIKKWGNKLINDLDQVLGIDPNRHDLATDFVKRINEIDN